MRDFLKTNAIALLSGALAAALVFGAVQTVRIEGFSVWPIRVEGLQAKADRFKGEAKAAREAVALSEGLRGQEQAQAVQSFNAAAERCEQRVATATGAGRVIGEIVNAPYPFPSPSAAQAGADSGGNRAIVPAGKLRVIVGQAAGDKAAVLPSGGAAQSRR